MSAFIPKLILHRILFDIPQIEKSGTYNVEVLNLHAANIVVHIEKNGTIMSKGLNGVSFVGNFKKGDRLRLELLSTEHIEDKLTFPLVRIQKIPSVRKKKKSAEA